MFSSKNYFGADACTFIYFIVLLFTSSSFGGESASSYSSSSYVSSRALNSFGNFVQLNHAKEAATRYGRPVIVAVVEDFSSSSSYAIVISIGNSPILKSIQLPVEENMQKRCTGNDGTRTLSSPFVACCMVGLNGDADWMLGQIRSYFSEVWVRYGMVTQLSTPTIAYIVARLLGRFAAHAEKREWQSTLGLPGKHESDEDRAAFSSWTRPLGVQTIILSLPSCTLSSNKRYEEPNEREPNLLLVEPSGRILYPAAKTKSGAVQISLAATGKSSEKVQRKLIRLLKGKQKAINHDNPFPTNLEICRDTLIQLLLQEVTFSSGRSNNQHDHIITVMVETISSNEKHIKRNLYRYENKDGLHLML